MYVLKRAALLIQELAGGKITGAVQDVYPAVAEPYTVEVTYEKINTLIGKDIPVETVKVSWQALRWRSYPRLPSTLLTERVPTITGSI